MGDMSNEKWLTRMLLLLPGILSLGIANYVANLTGYSDFELAAYSLGLSLVIFSVSTFLYRSPYLVARIFWRNPEPNADSSLVPLPSLSFISLIFLVTVALGLLIAHAYENDTFLGVLRESPGTRMITKRSSARPMVFLFSSNRKGELEEGRPPALKVQEAWVRIKLEGDKFFSGYPEFFPLSDKESEIFLSPACRESEAVVPLPGPGVLIREDSIEYIEFLDRGSSDCYRQWEVIAGATGEVEEVQKPVQ